MTAFALPRAHSLRALPRAVLLQMHTIDQGDSIRIGKLLVPLRIVVAEALDPATRAPVAALRLKDMAAWLASRGYRHRPGSSGIWERAR